jgi:hypothetical protein
VGNENADAQHDDNSSDSSTHKQLPARSSSVTKDPSAQSKEFIELSKLDSRSKIFGNVSVALQCNQTFVPASEPRISFYAGCDVVLAPFTGAGVGFHSHKFLNPATAYSW